MFRRRRSRARRANRAPRRHQRQRRLSLEPLEERRLLAIMTVTDLGDDTLANLLGDSQFSLREAIEAVNTGAAVDGIGPTSGAFGTNDEIQFAPGLFTGGPQTIALADVAGARELGLTRAMTITGPGATLLRIDAGDGTDGLFNTGDGFRIFNITDTTATNRPATLTGLKLTGGDVFGVNGVGGAIRSLESLTVRDSIITGNASTDHGGGIYVVNDVAPIQVLDSRITYNHSGGSGGGIYASSPNHDVVIARTTISGNRSTGLGGGGAYLPTVTGNIDISNTTIGFNLNTGAAGGGGLGLVFAGAGSATIDSSTISLNLADDNGGGVNLILVPGATTTISHTTITQNSSNDDGVGDGFGGGLYTAGAGTLEFDHSIIADNTDFTGTAPDLDVTTTPPSTLNLSFSLVGDNTGTGLTEAPVGAPDADGNLIGDPGGGGVIDPLLGLLAPNGGPTDTQALLAGSPAIDAGDMAIVMPPTNDQRGAPFDRIVGARIDMGAYERQTVAALNLVVDTLFDENDGDYSAGDLSLREAVGLANGSIGADTITFAAQLNGGTILLTLGEIRITGEVDIDASNLAARLTVDASGNDPTPLIDNGDGSRVFIIDDQTITNNPVEIRRLVLTGGDVTGDGGAIDSRESLVLTEVVVGDNAATDDGGGIAVHANSFRLMRSTVSNNSAGDDGGGVYISNSDSLILDSTISGNTATERGGGVYSDTDIDGTPTTKIRNSTVSGNTAGTRGGGVDNHDGLMLIEYSTITDNEAPAGAGSGVASFGDNATLTRVRSTIIAGNTNSDVDFGPGAVNSFESLGYNLIGMGNAVGEFVAVGDQNNVADPELAPLTPNGGPTETHRVLFSSPALDAGDPAAVAGAGNVPQFDQRGAPLTRVFDGNAGGVATIDIGAFELNQAPVAPDIFEPNDTQATATVLGSPPFLTVNFLTIHDVFDDGKDPVPPDEDFYKYVAHDTGKLSVRIYFTHALGDLDLRIHDINGNVIASSETFNDIEEVLFPVVSQQMYFVHVFGFLGATNAYTLEIENFPTPVPTGVLLDPASDTGMMDNDNVTSDNTPTFFIQTDVLNFVDSNGTEMFEDPDTILVNPDKIDVLTPAEAAAKNEAGIAVEVTFVNTTTGTSITGFAEPVIATLPEVFRFTVPGEAPLADGVYVIAARTRIFDPLESQLQVPTPATGRSNASPPLRLVIDTVGAPAGSISADMLKASDTGMRDDDNVTNKMQPAFQGIAPAGSKVRIFANAELVGQTVAGSDASDVGHGVGGIGGLANDGLGIWEITVEPLADNGYDIRVEVEDGAGNVTEFDPRFNGPDQRIDVVVDTLEPNTPYLDLIDDTGRHDNDNITKDNTPRVTMTSTDPNVNLAQILFQDNLKFRIYDRYENTGEFKLYDSALDADVDAMDVPLDMFTALTFIEERLPDQFFALFGGAANAAVVDILGIGRLADGVHNLKLEVEDRAGNFSHDFLLEITVDTNSPPVSFGEDEDTTDGLAASSDTGVLTMPMTFADRVTSDSTPTFWGRAEANSIVRVYFDEDNDGVIILGTEIFLGQTVAVPFDGNDAYPNGYWELTTALDLNEIDAVPRDGLRQLLVTAEDVAGNPMPKFIGGPISLPLVIDDVDVLQIFIDTQGPQITDVNLGPEIEYDLFDPKPSEDGPTPLVHSLFIDIKDFPARLVSDFDYEAIKKDIAETIGNYDLVGDYVGRVVIEQVIVHFEIVVSGQPALASIELVFAEPLPDDRYTLTVRDHLVDPAGNKLDGESGADDPSENPNFPSGDGVPGGNFVARFTIDTRPEIGVWAAGIIHIDTNGNFHFDPENVDFTNRDLIYTLGFSSDYIFAGNFAGPGMDGDFGTMDDPPADGFDKLAVYGRVGDQWRFLVDFDNDGVPDEEFLAPAVNGIPVAGNFDGNAANGDEVGVFTGSAWFFDTNHDFIVDDGFATDYAGFPVAGDFDGDGDDDVATYIASQSGGNQFHIDINTAGLGAPISINGSADHTFRVGLPGLGTFGFPGVRERPVAADMNADGADDLGLWVPDGTAILPGDQGEWFFLLSDSERVRYENGEVGLHVTDTVIDRIVAGGVVDFVPFSTTPFGSDLYARFGNSFALPIVGNFDPPTSPRSASTQRAGSSSTPTQASTPAPAPTATAPPATASTAAAPTTTAVAAVKVAVPAVATASSTVKAAARTATTSTTKSAKKIAVPAIQPAFSKTAASVATTAKTAKSKTKPVTPVIVPTVKSTAKVAKVKTVTTKKSSIVALPKPVVAAKAVTTQKALVTSATTKKAGTTSVAKPTVNKSTASSTASGSLVATMITPSPADVSAIMRSAAPNVSFVTFTPSNNALPQPQPLMLAAEPMMVSQSLADVPPVITQPIITPVVTVRADTGGLQVSTLSGVLEVETTQPAESSVTARHVRFEPAIADAAITDLRLSLAERKADAFAADCDDQFSHVDADDWHFANSADDELALELAWDSISLGVK